MSGAEAHLRAFFAAWMRHDVDEMAAFYAPDAVMEDPTLAEPRRGRGEIRRYYGDMFAALEDPEHALLDWAARGDRVWFEWTFGSGGRAAPRELYRGVSVQTLRDGAVVHDHAFWSPGG
jgi:ketosteroid isomerase-like protein